MFVTEDTTRAAPEDLRRLYTEAVEAGARRVCIADTVGHATPTGARNLVRFIREVVDATGETSRSTGTATRTAGSAVIERPGRRRAPAPTACTAPRSASASACGNCPIDLLLVNLQLLGWIDRDLSRLSEYCHFVAEVTGVPLPDNYPVVGRDAFRTATGVHASAIIKARQRGDEWLADRVYSSVPASLIGSRQVIEVGPMSGESNVLYWLTERGIPAEGELVREIFARAKRSPTVLTEAEILEICRTHGALAKSA